MSKIRQMMGWIGTVPFTDEVVEGDCPFRRDGTMRLSGKSWGFAGMSDSPRSTIETGIVGVPYLSIYLSIYLSMPIIEN